MYAFYYPKEEFSTDISKSMYYKLTIIVKEASLPGCLCLVILSQEAEIGRIIV
jgi:hypothetical protein